MTKVIEAIYSHGVLEPMESLNLADRQRVEITVRTLNDADSLPQMAPTKVEREKVLHELFEEIDRDNLQLRVRMPTRDEMHERG